MARSAPKQPAEAFIATIVPEHGRVLVQYLRRMGVRQQDLEDVLQEVLHGAAIASERFRPERGTMRSWLIGIASNQVSHYWDRAHRRHEQLVPAEELEVVLDEAPSSEARLIAADQQELLDELLAEVPIERRCVLVAHDLVEMPMEEVAEALSLNVHTAWSRHRAARQDLEAAAERWRARRRRRGEDDSLAVLAPLLGRGTPPRALRTGLARVVSCSALAVFVGVLGPTDAAPFADSVIATGPQAAEAAEVALAPALAAAIESAPEEPPLRSVEGPPPSPPAGAPDNARAAAPVRAEEGQLGAEAKLVERAGAAIAANQRNEALGLLEQHARAFPRGRLAARRNRLLRELEAK